jgi:hypothetical protein
VVTDAGADLGLQIVHWVGAGELKHLLTQTEGQNR